MSRLVPIVLDLLVVLIFAVVGRASHGLSAAGVFLTAWPFLVACVVAWVALWALSDDGYGLRAGIVVWLVTLCGGMGLRIATGDTAAPAFFVVATLFLGAALGGWRLLAWLLRRRSARTA